MQLFDLFVPELQLSRVKLHKALLDLADKSGGRIERDGCGCAECHMSYPAKHVGRRRNVTVHCLEPSSTHISMLQAMHQHLFTPAVAQAATSTSTSAPAQHHASWRIHRLAASGRDGYVDFPTACQSESCGVVSREKATQTTRGAQREWTQFQERGLDKVGPKGHEPCTVFRPQQVSQAPSAVSHPSASAAARCL